MVSLPLELELLYHQSQLTSFSATILELLSQEWSNLGDGISAVYIFMG